MLLETDPTALCRLGKLPGQGWTSDPLPWAVAQYASQNVVLSACSGPQVQDASAHSPVRPLDRRPDSTSLWPFPYSTFKLTAYFCGPILPLGK